MKSEVELFFESVKFFKDVLLCFHLKQKSLNQKSSKILLQNLLIDDLLMKSVYNTILSAIIKHPDKETVREMGYHEKVHNTAPLF